MNELNHIVTVISIILDKVSTLSEKDHCYSKGGMLYAIKIAQKLDSLQVPCSMCSLDGEKTLTSN